MCVYLCVLPWPTLKKQEITVIIFKTIASPEFAFVIVVVKPSTGRIGRSRSREGGGTTSVDEPRYRT